jgi:hypothetical protein
MRSGIFTIVTSMIISTVAFNVAEAFPVNVKIAIHNAIEPVACTVANGCRSAIRFRSNRRYSSIMRRYLGYTAHGPTNDLTVKSPSGVTYSFPGGLGLDPSWLSPDRDDDRTKSILRAFNSDQPSSDRDTDRTKSIPRGGGLCPGAMRGQDIKKRDPDRNILAALIRECQWLVGGAGR